MASPIHCIATQENEKNGNNTTTIFGNELHRYLISDGIRDKNVLGFDPYMVKTFSDQDLRKAVALEMSKASSEEEVLKNERKKRIYYEFMEQKPMAGEVDSSGKYVKGIEDYMKKHNIDDINDIIGKVQMN